MGCPGVVLNYSQSLERNSKLSLKVLTLKVTCLLALSHSNRGSELKFFDISLMRDINNSLIFSFTKQFKNFKKGKRPPDMELVTFDKEKHLPAEDRKLCPRQYFITSF